MSLFVGDKAPKFEGTAVIGGDATALSPDNAWKEISLDDYKGKWVVFFFYPEDFTFVCPTELEEFGNNYGKFQDMNCEVVGCSTDSRWSHLAWRSQHPALKNLPYALLADVTAENARAYNVYKEEGGYALRGLYIINPDGDLMYSVVHNEEIGRNSDEVLRVLAALQTGKKTACNWESGQDTLN